MISRERNLVLAGVLAGAVLSAALMTVFFLRSQSASAAQQNPSLPASSNRDTSEAAPAGTEPGTTVQLDPDEITAAEVQLAAVSTARLKSSVESVGRVEQPEAQLATIPARVAGRIDTLHVQFTGEEVRRGQAVAEIYSPELAAAAEEYRLALENHERMSGSSLKEAVESAGDLVAASRKRLQLLGVSEEQIAAAAAGSPGLHVTIFAPAGGSVVERKVTAGQYVNAGDPLFTVADLSTVWVKADVYEFQLPQIKPGQMVEITTDSLPDKVLHGHVDFIEPEANPQTRTIPVHVHVSNPAMRLRPGMYIRAKFVSPRERETLVLPRSAVLDTGTRKLVYISNGGGVFEAREIQAGAPAEDFYPVLAGVKAGEQVVVHGNFLIDSQTRLAGGMTGLFGGSKAYDEKSAAGAPTAAAEAKAAPSAATLSLTVVPSPPKGAAENMFHVSLLDAAGKAIPDAQVTVTLVMPAMPSMGMAEMRRSFQLPFVQGMYMGKGNVGMAGPWNVWVEAERNGQVIATYRTRFNAE
jgi:Cu(I)/Ag(I) efflux system membrane fusion protein